MHSETDASLASSGDCRHWATGLGGRQAAQSRPLDRRRRTPDGRACCDDVTNLLCVLMYGVFFKFYNCNEDIKPSAAFSCRHIKYKIHALEFTKTLHFYFKNSKNFLGRGHSRTPTLKSGYGPGNRMTLSDLAEFRRHGASCVSAHLSLLFVRVSRL